MLLPIFLNIRQNFQKNRNKLAIAVGSLYSTSVFVYIMNDSINDKIKRNNIIHENMIKNLEKEVAELRNTKLQ
jgi:hypothetical protein